MKVLHLTNKQACLWQFKLNIERKVSQTYYIEKLLERKILLEIRPKPKMRDGLDLLLIIIFTAVHQYITQLQSESWCHDSCEEQQRLRLWGNLILKDSKNVMDGTDCRADSWKRICPRSKGVFREENLCLAQRCTVKAETGLTGCVPQGTQTI